MKQKEEKEIKKKKKEKAQEPKNPYHVDHGLWSNVKYICRNMVRYEKSLPWLILLIAVATTSMRYLWNFIAKFVLDMVSNSESVEKLITLMVGVFVVQCATTMASSFANNQLWWRYIGVRTLMMVAKNRKIMTMKFEYLEDSDVMDAYQKAGNRVQDWETKLNNAKAETIDASRAVDENARYMDEAASSADGCAKSIDEYGKKTEDAAESSEKLGQSSTEAISDLGQSSTEAISDLESVLASAGILAALDRLKDGFMECAAAAESFEYAVAQVGTIAGAGNMDQMADQILALSNASGQASEELAQTAYSALSAGSAVESAVSDAKVATELATAGFTDTTSALQVLKTAMNSYGDAQSDLQHVSDSLIMTQNLGVTTIAELSQNMGVAIASASAYNVSLENLEAAYIATTKSGINTANSTTYLSRMFSELGDSGSTVSKIITNQTGKSFGQLMKEGYSLADVLEILYESCGNDAEAMMQLWQQQSSGKAANAIVNQGLQQFRQNLDRVTNSAGATSKAYGIMESTTQHAHERMANSMKNLASVVGGELNPVLEDVYNAIADGKLAPEFAAVSGESGGVANNTADGKSIVVMKAGKHLLHPVCECLERCQLGNEKPGRHRLLVCHRHRKPLC